VTAWALAVLASLRRIIVRPLAVSASLRRIIVRPLAVPASFRRVIVSLVLLFCHATLQHDLVSFLLSRRAPPR
jgi:hypothetical protein